MKLFGNEKRHLDFGMEHFSKINKRLILILKSGKCFINTIYFSLKIQIRFFGDFGRSWTSKKYLINLWQINEAHATFLLFYKCINIVFLHHNLEIKGCANFCPKKVEILENSFNLTILGLTGQLCNMRILQTSQHENSFFFMEMIAKCTQVNYVM